MKQRAATPVQRVMVFLMLFAYGTLAVWLVPEVRGILSPAREDTYSEWVWDLPGWTTVSIAVLHLLIGVLFVWSSIHFIEGWLARR